MPSHMLLDTHYHWDFLNHPQLQTEVWQILQDNHISLVGQTLCPQDFLSHIVRCQNITDPYHSYPVQAVGYHPWHIQPEVALDEFVKALDLTSFVGEIGLDFSPNRICLHGQKQQLRTFKYLVEQVYAKSQSKPQDIFVMSIHAVKAMSVINEVFSDFRENNANVVWVVHWFSGTSQELTQFTRLGGYLSLNPAMLESKRGRAYIKQVPQDRILLETDLPKQPVTPTSRDDISQLAQIHAQELIQTLQNTLSGISQIRGKDFLPVLLETQKLIYANLVTN